MKGVSMIDALLGSIGLRSESMVSSEPLRSVLASAPPRSPCDRSRGYRAKKHLIDPRHRAHVVAQRRVSMIYPGGCYEVRRDGVLTHFIVKSYDGWFIRRVKGNGMSNRYRTPELAVERHRLVVHGWNHQVAA